ncbi:DUF3054 domain-containing protein [Leifsonia sp. YAF41]|uniref:DUF3054 domain-containing protein n=1 Tax=Leifsonia sp. YAF41 TaxID=3233086 RepID=UPI003F9643F8
MATQRFSSASVVSAAALDAAFVLLFVLIGRASHNEGLAGVLTTWWPFLGGLAIGWLIVRAWRRPGAIVWTGLVVWLCTVVGGLALRALVGQGVQLSFAIVTTLVLGVFLLGWRAVWLLVRRVRSARSSQRSVNS